MLDENDGTAASVVVIILMSAVSVTVHRAKQQRRFWICPSLQARHEYSAVDFYERSSSR